MALQDVLSAIRVMILDVDSLPDSSQSREKMLEELFPKLSEHEREDLAKIPPEKLEIYTATIFTGESKIISNHFPLTLQALKPAWKDIYEQDFKPSHFAKRIHKLRPWQSYKTQAFVDCIKNAISNDFPDLLAHTPDLVSLANLEATAVEIKRAPDPVESDSELSIEKLQDFRVEELLETNLHTQPMNRFIALKSDAVAAFISFHRDRQNLELPLANQEVFALGSRTKKNFVRWTTLPERVWNLLSKVTDCKLQDVANIYANSQFREADEEKFALFMEDLVQLIRYNAVYLSRSHSSI